MAVPWESANAEQLEASDDLQRPGICPSDQVRCIWQSFHSQEYVLSVRIVSLFLGDHALTEVPVCALPL